MSISNFLIKIISTGLFIGYLPFIPGTFGSLAGVYLFYLTRGNNFVQLALLLFLIIIGFLVSGKAEIIFAKKDARCIVIDEISGMLLGLLFVPFNPAIILIAFFLFRLFDALKPYPACRFESLKGGLGIMSDDLVAGLYTNIILQIALRLVSVKIS